MKRLFLASSIDRIAKHIAKKISKDVKKLKIAFITTAAEPELEKNHDDREWFDNDRKGLINASFNIFDYTYLLTANYI